MAARTEVARTDNANYLWTQLFHSALNAKKAIAFFAPNKKPATGWKCTDAIVGH